MTDRIPIADVQLSDAAIGAAVDVLESGYLRQGDQTAAFEAEFADAVGADHAIAVSSGTAALHVAYLAALDGGEVVVPSFSFISTASMVHYAGCTPVFCDIDPETYTIDVEDARARVTEDTVGVAPVHLFGNACDIEGVMDLAADHDLRVFWDAAQAHGATYDGRDIGSFDDFVCYSFYPTKNMTTGEGGMITTNDDDLAAHCRNLRSHWQTDKYYHPDLGFNYRMTDMEAAIGRVQLDRLPEFVERRQELAAHYDERLADVDGVTIPHVDDRVGHSYNQYSILLDTDALGCSRDEFAARLDDHGVGTQVNYPIPLHEQPAFETHDVSLPTSERVADRILSLPMYPTLSEDDVETVAATVRAVATE
ncbi:DegT/DnrJ/EryC1/StrS family aminotransferase [Halorientalis pallida]|uniref:DegT/DnrJ/EryC1/StrS family aminotransferase n=1 Tax=Halorientalis pallida TaxID=2479928 RepID=UPI003C703DF7